MHAAPLRLLAVLVVPALVLVACGDGDGDDSDSGSGSGSGSASEPATGDGGDEGEEGALELSEEEQEYTDALAGTLEGVDAEIANCFAGAIVKGIGVDAFTDADVTPADIEAEGAALDLGDLGVEDPSDEEAEEVGELVDGCSDLVQFFLVLAGSALDETQAACVEGELTEDFVREFLVAALQNPDAEEVPADLQGKLDRINEECETTL